MNNRRLIELAIQGLEANKLRLENEIAELRRQLGSGRRKPITGQNSIVGMKSKGITAAGRKRLSELMTARWATRRAQIRKSK